MKGNKSLIITIIISLLTISDGTKIGDYAFTSNLKDTTTSG